MADKLKQIHLSLDLIKVSRRYLDFVKDHLNVIDLRREDVVKAALYRYQHFWLPLAARHPDKALEAPVDINWVWHCHMLSPLPYREDLQRLIGTVVGNESLLRTDEENEAMLKESKRLWNEVHAPDHPFFVDITGPVRPEYRDGEINFKAHILSNALRQKEFDYQVSLPHYDDPGYLASSVFRYRQFLYLKKVNMDMWVIPAYDIDFVWHAHQLCPLLYHTDMLSNLGEGFNHGDVPPGLPPDAKLHYPDLITRSAWVEEFGEAVSLFGAGYRGENPIGKMTDLDSDALALLAPRHVTLIANNVTVISGRTLGKNAKLKLETAMGSTKIPLYRRRTSTNRSGKSHHLRKIKEEGYIRFDTSESSTCVVKVSLLEKSHWGRTNGNSNNNSIQVDLTSFVATLKRDVPMHFETVLQVDGVTKLELKVISHTIEIKRASFSIRPGKRSQMDMTEDLKTTWGPIPLPEEPLGSKDVKVNLIIFKILDSKEQEAFTCRLLECEALQQEGTQVFFYDKMLAVSHPIGGIQLPYPSLVSNKKATATLDPLKGEKAALIKYNKGDWGILVAHLVKEKSVSFTDKNGRGLSLNEEEREYMNGVLWIMDDKVRVEFKLPNEKDEHELNIRGVNINLSTGIVKVDSPDCPVAECLAVAFSLKMLWKQCKMSAEQSVEKIPINKLAQMGRMFILGNRLKAFKQ